MAWGKAGSTTLTGAGNTLTTTGMTASKTNQFLAHEIASGSIRPELNFNTDTGSNYARRTSNNGGTDFTIASDNDIKLTDTGSIDDFQVGYFINIQTEEKLLIVLNVLNGASGAGTAPSRYETVGKWANTSAQISSLEIQEPESGSLATDSNLTVLGSELTPVTVNLPDSTLFVEKDTGNRYWNVGSTDFDFSATSTGAVSNQPTDATEVGQLITSTTHQGKKAQSATFYVKRVGSPGGTMVYKIRKSSDNSVVATSTGTSASALSTSTTAVTLDFNGEDIPSENIRVTVSGVTGSSGNVVTIYGGGADTIADQTLSVWGGSSWTEYGNDCAGKLTFTESWTMQPTYQTDFSSSTGWTQTGSHITISTGTNSLTWIGDRSTSSHGLHYDIGANRVSSKWILEFDFVLDNYSAGTASFTHQIGVMLTDVNSTSGTYGSDATRKFVGMRLNWRTDTASQQRKFYVIDDNAGTDTWADNSPANSPDDSTAQSFPTAGTTYHMKLIKDGSSHSLEIWNSSQSSLLDTLNGSNSTTADIRYILVQSYNVAADGNPSFDGKIQNMKFYNGVTSIN